MAIFAVQWMRTLFALDFELSVVFRLWDLFFVQGLEFVSNFILTMFHLAEGTNLIDLTESNRV